MSEAWITRADDLAHVRAALDRAPVMLLTGPRQVGKTVLVRHSLASDKSHYFELEGPRDLAKLAEPILALERIIVVHAGSEPFPLGERIEAVSAAEFVQATEPFD